MIAIEEFTMNNNPTHYIDSKWTRCDQFDYDTDGNCIHKKTICGTEMWYWYDIAGNLIHYKSSVGTKKRSETWYKYDTNGNKIHTICNREQVCTEQWYDTDGNCIHTKTSYGTEKWYKRWYKWFGRKSSNWTNWTEQWYDANGKLFHEKNSEGKEWWSECDTNGSKIHSPGYDEWYKWAPGGPNWTTAYG